MRVHFPECMSQTTTQRCIPLESYKLDIQSNCHHWVRVSKCASKLDIQSNHITGYLKVVQIVDSFICVRVTQNHPHLTHFLFIKFCSPLKIKKTHTTSTVLGIVWHSFPLNSAALPFKQYSRFPVTLPISGAQIMLVKQTISRFL